MHAPLSLANLGTLNNIVLCAHEKPTASATYPIDKCIEAKPSSILLCHIYGVSAGSVEL
jgi:hypothetical protein